MAYEPWKKSLDFGGNPDHIHDGVELGYGLVRAVSYSTWQWRVFNGNNFATSAASAEVCAQLSAVLAVRFDVVSVSLNLLAVDGR